MNLYRNKSVILGKLLVTMIENILKRMGESVQENETFANYLESMMKIQLEHSQSLIKNANKYLDPLKASYEARGSLNHEFIGCVKDLDVNQATSLADTTKQVRELVKTNIARNSDLVKKTAEKMNSQFKKQSKAMTETMKDADKAYDRFVRKFNNNEDSFRSGDKMDFE
jgi:F0F1-type ATP synthase membrane subunit b/b'